MLHRAFFQVHSGKLFEKKKKKKLFFTQSTLPHKALTDAYLTLAIASGHMKVLMHLKGTWPGMNLNDDEFWCSRLSHPGVVIYQMKVVRHKVRRKNVEGSAKMRLVFAKELGDHWGQCPQETEA